MLSIMKSKSVSYKPKLFFQKSVCPKSKLTVDPVYRLLLDMNVSDAPADYVADCDYVPTDTLTIRQLDSYFVFVLRVSQKIKKIQKNFTVLRVSQKIKKIQKNLTIETDFYGLPNNLITDHILYHNLGSRKFVGCTYTNYRSRAVIFMLLVIGGVELNPGPTQTYASIASKNQKTKNLTIVSDRSFDNVDPVYRLLDMNVSDAPADYVADCDYVPTDTLTIRQLDSYFVFVLRVSQKIKKIQKNFTVLRVSQKIKKIQKNLTIETDFYGLPNNLITDHILYHNLGSRKFVGCTYTNYRSRAVIFMLLVIGGVELNPGPTQTYASIASKNQKTKNLTIVSDRSFDNVDPVYRLLDMNVSDAPADYVADCDYIPTDKLTIRQLDCLRNQEGNCSWLNDAIVLSYLCRKLRTLGLLGKVIIVDTVVWQMNIFPNYWGSDRSRQMGRKTLSTFPTFSSDWGLALIPININNKHWVLGVLQKSTKQLLYFDPLRWFLHPSIRSRLEKIGQILLSEQISIVVAETNTFVHQTDSDSCGAHVCILGEKIAMGEGNLNYDDVVCARQWRQDAYNFLKNEIDKENFNQNGTITSEESSSVALSLENNITENDPSQKLVAQVISQLILYCQVT